ncbi:cytochrome c551 [Paenibacillus sp. 1_12]|uniref:c-type cytochrome n=1 Tax=Paenibacillus sp. 1_12 TaxID=1566278 RepID=UPI0008E4DAA4|nr:cytochrome c [Paenibacillus sp. 1_12]SFM03440.1 cytochrome c551 [Paenibacillus sp. 1_12]
MNTRTRLIITAIILLAFGVVSGCGSNTQNSGKEPFGGAKNASQNDGLVGAPEQVQSLYKQSCLSCHGGGLEGRVGPKTNLQQVGARLSKEQIEKQITGGGNGMPAFGSKLKPEETQALAEWLSTKR